MKVRRKFQVPSIAKRSLSAIALAVLTACGGGGDAGQNPGTPDPGALTPEQLGLTLKAGYSQTSIDAATQALRSSGYTVLNDDGSQDIAAVAQQQVGVTTGAGSGGMSVLKFQVMGMARETYNGDGFTGAAIDRTTPPIPLPGVDQQITISMLLAAYVKTADTSGARLARSLMGDIDTANYAGYVYPTIVVMSFLQEVAVPMLAEMELVNGPEASAAAANGLVAGLAALSDPCGTINSMLDDLPGAVSNAISSVSPESSGFLSGLVSVAATIGGVAAGLAVDAAKNFVRHLPAVSAVRNGMRVVHAGADIKAMLSHWDVSVTAAPTQLHKSPGDPTAGIFTVSLTGSGPTLPSWPPALQSCADLLAIPLPDFNNPSATVEWKTIAGFNALAIESSRENALSGSKAEFRFDTATESQSVHDNPGSVVLNGPATVEAKVSLPGLESLVQTLAPSIGGTASQVATGASTPVAQEFGMVKQGTATVEYHSPRVARITFDNGLERLNVESPDGLSPDGSWSGTFASNLGMGQCGGWREVPVSWTFIGGTATLNVNLTFPGNGIVMESCSFNFSETLTLTTDPGGASGTVSTSGFYDSSMDPIDPGFETPPIETAGSRFESYNVELIGAP